MDQILVNVDSQDLWINLFLQMNSTEKNFESDFEIKIDNNMNGKELKLVIQKLSISIWNRLYEENKNQQMKIYQDKNTQLAHQLYFNQYPCIKIR